MKVAVVDCQTSGVTGEKLLGSLLDIGVSSDKVKRAMEIAKEAVRGCKDLTVTVTTTRGQGIRAKRVEVRVSEERSVTPCARLREAALACSRGLALPERGKAFVVNVIETLVEAEAKVHGISVDSVHLHELGSAKPLALLMGTAVALDELALLGEAKVYSTPVAVGGGSVEISHGRACVPTPATLEILRSRRFPILGGPIEAELTTPLGASMLVNLASGARAVYPPMRVEAVGYGAGDEIGSLPNALRIVVGEGDLEVL